MAHLHSYMERVDFHVALELCEIVSESATIVAILKSGWKKKIVSAGGRCNGREASARLSNRKAFVISVVKDLGRKFAMPRTPSPTREPRVLPGVRGVLSDGNDGSRFD
jgi:hypothetical protein